MPDTPMETTPPRPDLEFRVSRLEQDMVEVKSVLGQILPMIVRIDATLTATLPTLATKAELIGTKAELIGGVSALQNQMHGEFAKIRSELAEKPSKTYLWAILGVLIIAYAARLAGLAILK